MIKNKTIDTNKLEHVSNTIRDYDDIMSELQQIRTEVKEIAIILGMNAEYANNHIASSAFVRGWLISQRKYN